MPYEYLEDGVTSDVTFHAWGHDLGELFTAAADATTNVMAGSLDAIRPTVHRDGVVRAGSLDLLLMQVLDELIFHKDAHGLLLRIRAVHISSTDGTRRARFQLAGEPIDRARHDLAADVKAVTLHGLRVEWDGTAWHAQVTLDV